MARSTSAVQTAATPRPGRSTSKAAAPSKRRSAAESSDVLVSAVISPYLLTHLHHVLQRAEFGAQQEGRSALAANYAQLRKVLCLDARSMEDAFAAGTPETDAPCAA
ncbi:MAG: hypothetical protein VKM97_03895 [Cyanobacteriota bacterium]|nr:hypothetical protein [Cyanobacteriota bacterium]